MSLKVTIISNATSDRSKPEPCTYNTLNWTYDNNSEYQAVAYLQKSDSKDPKKADNYSDKPTTIGLVEMSFDKQMYRPCEMKLRMHFTGTTPSMKELNKNFRGCKVTLVETHEITEQGTKCLVEDTIAQDYEVFKLIPQYMSGTLYVDFVIYSPDYQLTVNKDRCSYVAKRLGVDLLESKKGKLTTVLAPKNKLYYQEVKDSSQKHDYDDEYIHPYLVQFDESFYDLLVRTANRWGEFIYYEDGKLIFGRTTFTATSKTKDNVKVYYNKDLSTVSTYDSLTYHNGNSDNPATLNLKDIVTQDAYHAVIKKSNFLKHMGDLFAFDKFYAARVIQSLLNMKGNVFDWAADTAATHLLEAGQNEVYLNKKEKEYNKTYFKNPFYSDDKQKNAYSGRDLRRIQDQYKYSTNDKSDKSKVSEYCQFSTYETDENKGLKSKVYQAVLKNELKAGEEMICLNFGCNYQHLRLGDIFTLSDDSKTQYIVYRVECAIDRKPVIAKNSQGIQYIKEDKQLLFRVYAVKQIEKDVFYPPVLPAGHVRFSGPQVAKIDDTFDPMMNARYRVKYGWTTEDATPWLPVSHEMLTRGGGSVWQLEKDTMVLLNYEDGNIERPYIVGEFQTASIPAMGAAMYNTMCLQTPAGHTIRMSDGYGAGATAFIGNLAPALNLIQGFCKEASLVDTEDSKFFEGGMELKDAFGMYCISGSTDQRNITIRSPFGDVMISAFSGITISAPNGDVKIKGKNVTIEAGNKLVIESGKNITNGLLGTGSIKNDALNALENVALKYTDISILRTIFETFLRPVSGTMTIKSNRDMLLSVGVTEAEGKGDVPNFFKAWLKKNVTDSIQETIGLRDDFAWDKLQGQLGISYADAAGERHTTFFKDDLNENEFGSGVPGFSDPAKKKNSLPDIIIDANDLIQNDSLDDNHSVKETGSKNNLLDTSEVLKENNKLNKTLPNIIVKLDDDEE